VQSSHSSFIFQEEDNESVNENDADLNKSLNKQRRHAVAAAPGSRGGVLHPEALTKTRVANPPKIPECRDNCAAGEISKSFVQ